MQREIIFFLLLFATNIVVAQSHTKDTTNILLNTITVTSGKCDKPLGEVSISLDILKPNLINNSHTVKIDQVIEKVSGVNIINGQANIRGGARFSYSAGSRVLERV